MGRPQYAPALDRSTYTSLDCALRLGITVDGFLRIYRRLVDEKAMPSSRTPGRIRIDKASFDAWMGADHPHSPKGRAANDEAPLAVPADDAAWRAQLARVYGGGRDGR